MTNRKLSTRFRRFAAVLVVGGSVFQLGGCDPAVRSTILSGLESTTTSLTNTLISAFFISLEDDEASSTSLTTT